VHIVETYFDKKQNKYYVFAALDKIKFRARTATRKKGNNRVVQTLSDCLKTINPGL
jgi:hypothetical protein